MVLTNKSSSVTAFPLETFLVTPQPDVYFENTEQYRYTDLNIVILPNKNWMESPSQQGRSLPVKSSSQNNGCGYVRKKAKKKRNKLRNLKKSQKYTKHLKPILVGLMTAKAILLPVALKALALMATKGVILGLISTMLTLVLSLRYWLDLHMYQSHDNNHRGDAKTQIEILQIPVKEKTHHSHYYSNVLPHGHEYM